VITAECKVVGS